MSEKNLSQEEVDAELLADLFTEDMTVKQRYDKLANLCWQLNNSDYCESMAGRISAGQPDAQALEWEKNHARRFAIERECERLRNRLEHYEGNTDEEGRPHGKGKKYYSLGNWYEGEWKHGVREGFGIEYAEDGTKRYEGNWEKDKWYGEGILIDYRRIRYEGFFEKEPPYGEYQISVKKHSIITYPDGERVEGPLENGNYLCTYPNGDTLECENFSTPGRGRVYPWPRGSGIFRFTDGSKLYGKWYSRDGKDGTFQYIAPDGTKTVRIYEKDELVSETPVEA